MGHPVSEPNATGRLDVGDGQRIYWAEYGNPAGKPAVVLHGGPGAPSAPRMAARFDQSVYRVVLFDQRGCGLSTPSVAELGTDLSTNTTEHLLGDIERLREHLGIERWLVFGGSWGSSLGFAYAERWPERVTELVLVAVTSGRRAEFDWLYEGLGRFFPEAWERFRDGVPEAERDGNLLEAYDRLLNSPDLAVRERAAADWCAWEAAAVTLDPDEAPDPRWSDPVFRLEFARLCAHYFSRRAWFSEDQLLREAGKLAGIPGVMVHGRLDLTAPLDTAYAMSKAWPDAELVVVNSGGHHANDEMTAALRDAFERFGRPTG